MRLHTISCSPACPAGMPWLLLHHKNVGVPSPKPSLNRQVGRLNPRLIWENPGVVSKVSSLLWQRLQFGHPHLNTPRCQTWHSHCPLAPEIVKHPWIQPALCRMDTPSPGHSGFISEHHLCVKAGLNTVRFTPNPTPVDLRQHSPDTAPIRYHRWFLVALLQIPLSWRYFTL